MKIKRLKLQFSVFCINFYSIGLHLDWKTKFSSLLFFKITQNLLFRRKFSLELIYLSFMRNELNFLSNICSKSDKETSTLLSFHFDDYFATFKFQILIFVFEFHCETSNNESFSWKRFKNLNYSIIQTKWNFVSNCKIE